MPAWNADSTHLINSDTILCKVIAIESEDTNMSATRPQSNQPKLPMQGISQPTREEVFHLPRGAHFDTSCNGP